jgi:hypothetical protein
MRYVTSALTYIVLSGKKSVGQMALKETRMITHRGIGILSAAIVCALSAAPSQAAYVTYSASGIITEADPGPYPTALSAAAAGEKISVDFTVNTSMPGSIFAPGGKFYQSAIVSADASIGSGTVGIGVDTNSITIDHNLFTGGNYYSGYVATSSSDAIPVDFTGYSSAFQLITVAANSAPLNVYKNASLSNAPLQSAKASALDTLELVFSSWVDGVFQSTSDIIVGNDVSIKRVNHVTAPEIDPASATSALTLLMGGLAVLRGRRRIKVTE